jgi:aminopeptidase N
VKVEHAISDDDLEFLMAFDSDEFARWESAQVLTERVIRSLVNDLQSGRPLQAPARLTRALQALLDDDNVDNEFKAKMLSLPSEQYLAQYFANHSYVDVDAIHRARQHVIQSIGRDLKGTLLVVYKTLADAAAKSVAQSHDSKAIGDRALKNIVLEFIAASGEPRDLEIAFDQAEKARNMTEELGALQALNAADSEQRNRALQLFQARWKNEALVMNKWLSIQAIAPVSNSLERVRELTKSDAYDATNPNKIYSLIYAFAQFNTIGFHARSGDAYRFIADQIIEIDTRNPQVASRLMSTFNQWKTFDQQRKELMRSQIERILAQPGVSPNVFELASKALA